MKKKLLENISILNVVEKFIYKNKGGVVEV